MTATTRFTSQDLQVLPQDNRRYEIVDGQLLVSTMPHFMHQHVCGRFDFCLVDWSDRTGLGMAYFAPGLVFTEDNDVAPDVVWATWGRLKEIMGEDGHFQGPPNLVIEVLSPGPANETRDRQTKLKLYSRRRVDEYWIVDWRRMTVDVFRRVGDVLEASGILTGSDVLRSPNLPGFSSSLAILFS